MKFGKLAATAVGSWVEDEEQEAIESMHLALAVVASRLAPAEDEQEGEDERKEGIKFVDDCAEESRHVFES